MYVQCVVLHSLDTEILEDRVELLLDGFSLTVSGVGYDYDREFLILYTQDTLSPGLPLDISIEFIRQVYHLHKWHLHA
jgi:hypothetical protein